MRGADTNTLIDTLVAAFWDDPFYAWLYGRADLAEALHDNFEVVLTSAGHGAHVDYTHDGRAVAVWTDPDVSLLDDATPFFDVLHRWAPDRVNDAISGIDECHVHQPDRAHVLHLIGVHPDLAGRGVGTRLVAPRLSAIDDVGGVTYLESSNRRNHGFYRRLGFGPVTRVQVGDGPTMWPMVRDRRSAPRPVRRGT